MPDERAETDESQGQATSNLAWFLTGAFIGAAAAVLYAPQSGKETRKYLSDKTQRGRDAVESAGQLGVRMLTIHLSGGSEMIRAATTARANNMLLLGVTVLTSSTEETQREIGIASGVADQVLRLAKLGVNAGIDGVVASPHEIKPLRREFAHKMKIVVPGIRPSGAEANDQKRTMSPRDALDAGADYLVIGRPITAHRNPREAVDKILEELRC